MKLRTLLSVASVCLLGAACTTTTPIGAQDPVVTSGNPPPGAAGAGGAGGSGPAPVPPGVPPDQCPYVPAGAQVVTDHPFTVPSSVAGDWTGYFENFHFPSGSDAIALHFGIEPDGHATLRVTLGTGTVPPPPTDPYEAWPPHDGTPYPAADSPQPVEGFAYTAHEVTWDGTRLTFALVDAQPWADWCCLQTSYPLFANQLVYACNAGADVVFPTASTCAYLDAPSARCTPTHHNMCLPKFAYCACNDTGCGVDVTYRDRYDITFAPDHAAGSRVQRSAAGSPSNNVRLTPATAP